MNGRQTNKEVALKKAVAEGRVALAGIDIPARCRLLAPGKDLCSVSSFFPAPRSPLPARQISFRMFGQDMLFDMNALTLVQAESRQPAKDGDLVLLLHYLQNDVAIRKTGELITFRQFPGGQFYYQPFQARSSEILKKRFAGQLEALKTNLDRFDWEPLTSGGDVGALIHAFGSLYCAIVFTDRDEEFAATADVLFDSGVKRALCAEDAAVMATRICVGLL